jgi:uncharacterized protein (TIGR01244 family)
MNLDPSQFNLKNGRLVTPTLLSAGQPDAATLAALKTAGVQHVLNLRPAEEDTSFDTAATARGLGFTYHALPVAGPAGLTLDNVKRFDALLATIGNAPTLVHCASGNRVGALFALRAAWLQGKSADEAMAEGARAGLTQMAAAVAPLLASKPAG